MGQALLGTTDGIWSVELERGDPVRIALAGQAITQLLRDDRGTMNAVDGRRIWRSSDGWRHVTGSALPEQQAVTVVAISPHPPFTLFAGSIPAALFRSDDRGSTWQAVAGFDRCPGRESWTFPGASPQPRVNAIAFDAQDPATLFATVEVGGIIRSRDGGESWENCSEQVNRDAHFLAAHPSRGGVVYASTGFGSRQPGGVYRSADHGTTWQYRFAGLSPSYTRPLVLDPRLDDWLYVAATPQQPPYWALPEGPGSVLWRGLGGGEAWAVVFPDEPQVAQRPTYLVSALSPDPETPGALYFASSEVTSVLHAIGALGLPPGGPFPLPAAGQRATPEAGAPAIAQAREVLQQRLAALDAGDARGQGEVWRLDANGMARRLYAELPAVLSILL